MKTEGMTRRIILSLLRWQVRRLAKAWCLHDVRDVMGLANARERYAKATNRLVRWERKLKA